MKKKDNYDYFDEFIALTDCIIKSAEILKDVFMKFHLDDLDNEIIEVHKLENEADQIIHDMRNYLVKDFLPPIDREDITLIGHKLDDIEDGIDEVLINTRVLNITEIKPEVSELTELLVTCCQSVREIFLSFKNFKNLHLMEEKAIEVNQLEEQGDRIYEKLMTDLYRKEKDAITLMKWDKIYNWLEDTIDACEELSDCIEDVVLKNS